MTCCRVHSVVDPAARILRPPSMRLDAHAHPWHTATFTASTAILAAALLWQLALVGVPHGDHPMSLVAVVIVAVGLVLSETRPTSWMRAGERTGATRGWAFAYALVLLGQPMAAIAVMVAARSYFDVSRAKSTHEILYDGAHIVASLSMGSLVLAVFGVHGNIASTSTMSIGNGFGIVLGGLAIFVVDGLLSAAAIGLDQEAGILRAAGAAFRRSIAADGALLALAPVLAIGAESPVVAVPLVALAAWLAGRAAFSTLSDRYGLAPDPLTGLPNRVAFERRLGARLDRSHCDEPVAVLVMDLDRFRQVNDRFGHQVGDLVLLSFAERLATVLPPAARLARLNGDEFAAFFRLDDPTGHRSGLVERLNGLLTERHTIDGVTLVTSVSIGVAASPIDGIDAPTLISSARATMQRAKRHRTGIEFGTRPNERDDRTRRQHRSGAIEPATGATRELCPVGGSAR